MDSQQYKEAAKDLTEYIANYLETIRERKVMPDVEPGYLRHLLPTEAPIKGEPWSEIFRDIDRAIMPGVTHWQSPHMHSYFPALNSYPSLLGDMLADAINCIGFTWASSPACTELEALVMDWLGVMIGLPDKFIHTKTKTAGGGIIQTTLSDSTFVSILAARNNTIAQEAPPEFAPNTTTVPSPENSNQLLQDPDAFPKWRGEISARLVAYCSDQAHSSVEKACFASLIELRILPSGDDFGLSGDTLEKAVIEDLNRGKLPFYVCAVLGTTGCCAFDHLDEIAEVCQEYNLWLHVDAAYAGATFVCPEFQHFMKGIQYVQSFAFNPSKYLLCHFDCTAMWVEDSRLLHRTFNVDPLYLQHDRAGAAIDYMHWQIPLSRRFRSLKLWFVIRSFGVAGLQSHIRRGIERAKQFEELVAADRRFEIPATRHMGLVVFRLKGSNGKTERLLKALNKDKRLHCVPANLKGRYVVRFVVTSTHTTPDDIVRDWSIIQGCATAVINDNNYMDLKLHRNERSQTVVSMLSHGSVDIGKEDSLLPCEGISLLLSNVPDSPKLINCSYAALAGEAELDRFFSEGSTPSQWSRGGEPSPLLPRQRMRVTSNGSLKQYTSPQKPPHPTTAFKFPSHVSNSQDNVDKAGRQTEVASGSSQGASVTASTPSTPSAKHRLKTEAVAKAENVLNAMRSGFKGLGANLASIANKYPKASGLVNRKDKH